VTTSIYPLIGLSAVMAASGCAAVPALNMASSLIKPAQPAQTGAPSPDIFSSLAQRLGIGQPAAQGTRTAAAQTGTTQTATTETATAASQ